MRYLDRGNLGFSGLPLKSPGESRREVVAVEVHPLEKIRMDNVRFGIGNGGAFRLLFPEFYFSS